jgi:hypothetical protein
MFRRTASAYVVRRRHLYPPECRSPVPCLNRAGLFGATALSTPGHDQTFASAIACCALDQPRSPRAVGVAENSKRTYVRPSLGAIPGFMILVIVRNARTAPGSTHQSVTVPCRVATNLAGELARRPTSRAVKPLSYCAPGSSAAGGSGLTDATRCVQQVRVNPRLTRVPRVRLLAVGVAVDRAPLPVLPTVRDTPCRGALTHAAPTTGSADDGR